MQCRANDTQKAFDRAYADATKNTPQVRAAVTRDVQEKSLIYVQIADASQRAAAERLGDQLRAAGYSAQGIEQVKVAPSTPELRYFRGDDKAEASKIVDQLKGWGFVDVRVRLISGYEEEAKLKQFELWLPAEDASAIETLAAQLDDRSVDARKAAGQALQDSYTASPRAIGAVLQLLESQDGLSENGRINALYFLSRTAPLAWDDALATRGRVMVARLQKSGGLGSQTAAELARFERVLDTARVKSVEPAGGTIAPVR